MVILKQYYKQHEPYTLIISNEIPKTNDKVINSFGDYGVLKMYNQIKVIQVNNNNTVKISPNSILFKVIKELSYDGSKVDGECLD